MFDRRFSEDLTAALGAVHIQGVLDLPNPSPSPSYPSREAFDLIDGLAQLCQKLLRPPRRSMNRRLYFLAGGQAFRRQKIQLPGCQLSPSCACLSKRRQVTAIA